jgi:hypothetical protein
VRIASNTITLVPPPESNAHRNSCGEETIEFDKVLPPAMTQQEVRECVAVISQPSIRNRLLFLRLAGK